jgi:hypothetical protein
VRSDVRVDFELKLKQSLSRWLFGGKWDSRSMERDTEDLRSKVKRAQQYDGPMVAGVLRYNSHAELQRSLLGMDGTARRS